MRRSESIAKIAEALAKAQGAIKGASKDSRNPHFGNKYADLSSVWDACREALTANGIAVVQAPAAEGQKVTVTTLLSHVSGEWMESDLCVSAQQATAQGVGSAITYARRYALAAMAGVAPEDDDGEAASGRQTEPEKVERPQTRASSLKAKVAQANGKHPEPIDAFKMTALHEATLLLQDETRAKSWLCGIREDPKAQRAWSEADVEKVKGALALLRAKTNTNGADEFGLEANP